MKARDKYTQVNLSADKFRQLANYIDQGCEVEFYNYKQCINYTVKNSAGITEVICTVAIKK